MTAWLHANPPPENGKRFERTTAYFLSTTLALLSETTPWLYRDALDLRWRAHGIAPKEFRRMRTAFLALIPIKWPVSMRSSQKLLSFCAPPRYLVFSG